MPTKPIIAPDPARFIYSNSRAGVAGAGTTGHPNCNLKRRRVEVTLAITAVKIQFQNESGRDLSRGSGRIWQRVLGKLGGVCLRWRSTYDKPKPILSGGGYNVFPQTRCGFFDVTPFQNIFSLCPRLRKSSDVDWSYERKWMLMHYCSHFDVAYTYFFLEENAPVAFLTVSSQCFCSRSTFEFC